MKKKFKISIPSKYLFAILAVLCLSGIFIGFTTDITAGPLKSVAGHVLVPIQSGLNHIGRRISTFADNLQTLKEVQSENAQLKQEMDELKVENNFLKQELYQLQELEDLYQLDQEYASYEKIAATVIGKDPGNYFDNFVIDKGSKDGIQVDMNVIADGGLVGIVTEVGNTWARVRSIIDERNNVSAKILATQDICTVTGDLETMMESGVIQMQQLMDSDHNVKVGDQVVTSQISSKYLDGILIGYVSDVTNDANKLTQSGTITPVVDFEHLETVLVITTLKESVE
jgi:rod shape-determining protein MreC